MADEGKQAGQAFVAITPDFRNFHKSIEKQLQGVAPQFAQAGADAGKAFSTAFAKSVGNPFGPLKPPDQTPSGAKAGGQFADGFRKAVDSAIRSLPKIQLDADASPAERRIQEIRAELQELSSKRIGVDMDADAALAKAAELQAELATLSRKSVNIRAKFDAAGASAELGAFVGEVDSASASANVMSEAFSGGIGPLGGLVSLGVALAPALAGAAAAATGLAGALASAAGAGAIGTGAFALVAIPAVTQIKNALTAQKTAQQAATGATAQGASAAQAEAVALDGVKQAEQSLTTAQQNAKTAQQALSAARVQARKDAVDLANSVTDAELQEKSDALGVIGARQALLAQEQQTAQAEQAVASARSALATAQGNAVTVGANPGSTAAQKAAAAAAVTAAKQQLQAAKQAAAQQELAQRQAKLAVAQAIQQLKEQRIAVQRLQQQQAASDKAGISGDKNVIAARKQVRQADQQVQQAELSLARARLSASRAGAAESSSGSAAAAKAAAAMAALSGPQRTLLKAWQALTGEFNKWGRSLQKPVLRVLTSGLQLAGRLLPKLTPFVLGAAKAFDGLLSKAGKALGGPFWTTFGKVMAKLAPKAITGFGTALLNIATGLAGIAVAFAPLAGPVLKGIDRLTASFASWGKNLGKSSAFQQFMTFFQKDGPVFLSLLGQLIELFFKFGVALLPLGVVMAKAALKIVRFLNSMPPEKILAIAAAVTVLLAALLGGIPLVIAATIAVAAVIASKWKTIVKAFRTAWSDITAAFRDAIKFIKQQGSAFWDYYKGLFTAGIRNVTSAWDGLWSTLKGAATTFFGWIKSGIATVWSGIQKAFTSGVKAVGKVWSGLKSVLKAPVNWVITHIFNDGLISAFDWISGKVGGPHINKIPTLAKGGRVTAGTTATADDVLARISRGETVVSAAHSKVLAPLFGAVGVPGYAKGGTPGSKRGQPASGIWHDITNAFGKVVDIGKILAAISTGNSKALTSDIGKLIGSQNSGATADLGKLLTAIPHTLVGDVVKFFTKHFPGGGTVGSGSGSAVARYADQYATGLNHPYVLGGATPAGWDCSGFAAWVYEHFGYFPGGQRSRYGTSETQFASSLLKPSGPQPGALVFFDDGIFANPGHVGVMLNRDTYVGADSESVGTIASSAAGAVGWRIPKGGFKPAKFDQGGVIQPGFNAVVNASRKPEALLSNSQWAMVSRAVQGGDGASGDNHYHFGDVGGTVEHKIRAGIAAADIARRRELRPGRKH